MSAVCFLHLEPMWRNGVYDGFTISKVTQRKPSRGISVMLVLDVPAHVFDPVLARVQLDVPATAVEVHAVVEEPVA